MTESALYNPVNDPALVVDFVCTHGVFISGSVQAWLAATHHSDNWPKSSSASPGAFGTGMSKQYMGECSVSMQQGQTQRQWTLGLPAANHTIYRLQPYSIWLVYGQTHTIYRLWPYSIQLVYGQTCTVSHTVSTGNWHA